MGSEKKVFVREATGLVRAYSPFEGFIGNFGNVSPIFSAAFTTLFIYGAVPGGDVVFNTFLAMMFGVFGYCAAIALLSASMPRSGAPYVAQSRILHPSIGFTFETAEWFAGTPALASYATAYLIYWGLAPGLYILGRTTGNSALVDLGAAIATPIWATVVGTIFMLATFAIAIVGVRLLLRYFQWVFFAIYVVGFAYVLLLLATSTHADFVTKFNIFVGQNYDDVIKLAQTSYPAAFAPITYAPVVLLAALGMTGGTTNTYWTAYYTGEMKSANTVRGQFINMVVSCIVLGLGVIAIVALEEGIIGRDFLVAVTQLSSNNPAALAAPLVRGGAVTNFVIFILAPPAGQALWLVTLVAASLLACPVSWMVGSRLLFAWSFDRLLPEKMSGVSERFHTPVVALTTLLIVSEAFLLLIVWTPFLNQILALGWMYAELPISITCLAAAIYPFRKKLYDLSPAKTWTIASIPLITIFGVLGFLYNINAAYQYWVIYLGTSPWFIVFFIVMFALYWVIKAIRKRQGIDLNLLFTQLPPE